jgi:hypothetical protein
VWCGVVVERRYHNSRRQDLQQYLQLLATHPYITKNAHRQGIEVAQVLLALLPGSAEAHLCRMYRINIIARDQAQESQNENERERERERETDPCRPSGSVQFIDGLARTIQQIKVGIDSVNTKAGQLRESRDKAQAATLTPTRSSDDEQCVVVDESEPVLTLLLTIERIFEHGLKGMLFYSRVVVR